MSEYTDILALMVQARERASAAGLREARDIIHEAGLRLRDLDVADTQKWAEAHGWPAVASTTKRGPG